MALTISNESIAMSKAIDIAQRAWAKNYHEGNKSAATKKSERIEAYLMDRQAILSMVAMVRANE